MKLIEELKDRADKLDAEMLALSGRLKEIERESLEVYTCINALDLAEMDAEDDAEREEIEDMWEDDENSPKGCAPPELQQVLSEALEADALTPPAQAVEAEPAIPERTKLGEPVEFLTNLIAQGGTWHDGGPNPAPNKFVDIYVPAASTNLGDEGHHLEGQPSNAYVWENWEVAYRIISEPAAGEGEAADYSRDPWELGHVAGFSAHDKDPSKSDIWQDGYNAGERDRANNIKLGEPVPNYDGTGPEPGDTGGYQHVVDAEPALTDEVLEAITELAEAKLAEQEAELAPLLPPEPPKPATPEQLEAAGIVDGTASWWARKLAKEPA